MKAFDTSNIRTLAELNLVLDSNLITYNHELIKLSYEFAVSAHLGQKRLSGEDYVEHSLTVAYYVAQLSLDTASICAALLHDVLEKSDVTIDTIDEKFGTEVAFIVDGLTTLKALSKKLPSVSVAENNFNSLIFNSSEDIRIIIIRLAGKIHNLMNVDEIPEAKTTRSANKAKNVYAPLAGFLGLAVFRQILLDRAFELLNPELFNTIKDKIDQYFVNSEKDISKFQDKVMSLLEKFGLKNFKMKARKKGIYSAYKKLVAVHGYKQELNNLDSAMEKLLDIYATRVIVDSIKDCYLVLGLLQSNFSLIQSEFDDYIAVPKENGYRSLHTIAMFRDKSFEVQVRTHEMHEYNEFGPASHIAYKLQRSSKESYTWTKDLVTWKDKSKLKKEDFQVRVFQKSIFCFTPKGEVIGLDRGATPLDFAYKIHTDVGERYQGALVNDKMVSMDYLLNTGDVVKIITNKQSNVRRNWLNYAKCKNTRTRIRRYLKVERENS